MNRIILQGEKSASFPFIRSFRQSNRNSKGSEKKNENSRREEELAILEFRGHGGNEHFGISAGKGVVKILMPPVVGYGYFQESPNMFVRQE